MNKRRIVYSTTVLIVTMLLSLVVLHIQTPTASGDVLKDTAQATVNAEATQLTEEKITIITEQFMDILVQPIHRDYRVKKLGSKQDLYEKFSSIATYSVAKPFVEYYYREKSDGLYLRPTSKPAWFLKGEPYEITEQSDNQVIITQTNETTFYGDYTIKFAFSFDKQWKITNIEYPK
ncbi:hypothetical protein [Virgibacillus sp. Bac330]|uniref:hypothetical protein n=1 Tax=Virgibacillus sp. Bac330 TaxID=2419841 RepID=UPI000EF48A09|nr:hypothetical protein [Virgibacillus sp. Bac330]